MNLEELEKILIEHRWWIGGRENGKRAYLTGANLAGADLRGANLIGAYLRGANLAAGNLRDANLTRACLRGVNLTDADLVGANLKGADLTGAILTRANLTVANLMGARLDGANLDDIKEDLFLVLASAKAEVPFLYKALMDGKIQGTRYRSRCESLIGTIASARNLHVRKLPLELKPNPSSPAQIWFRAINQGDTPENNEVSAITAEWLREFAKKNEIALPTREVVWR